MGTSIPDNIEFEDLEPRKIKVKLGKLHYVLREPDTDAVLKHRNFLLREARMSESGKSVERFGDVADAEVVMVSRCLYEVMGPNDETPKYQIGNSGRIKFVSEQFVRDLPYRVQEKLYQAVRQMGNLDEEDTPEVLSEKIEDLQNRLQELQSRKESEGNPTEPTTITSS